MAKYFRYFQIILKSDLLFPVILVVVYVTFLFVARGVIPTGEEIVNSFAALYKKYGYEIIFAAAFLESLVLVNLFVPGQLAMALGAVFARTGQTELSLVILTASMGAITGYSLDFILGYFGFSDVIRKLGYGEFLNETKHQLKRFGKRGLILGFVHSNIGSFLSLVAGAIHFEWKVFILLASLSTFVWLTVWAIAVYILGDIFVEVFKRYAMLIVLVALSGMILMRFWKKDKE